MIKPILLVGEALGQNEHRINRSWHESNFYERKEEVERLFALEFRYADVCELMQVSRSALAAFCKKYKLKGLSQGAQKGNINAVTHSLGKTTIRRLTSKVVLEDGRDLYTCERCDHIDPFNIPLPRHHKDRDRSNNAPSNIEVLCQSCHALEHLNELDRDQFGRFKT